MTNPPPRPALRKATGEEQIEFRDGFGTLIDYDSFYLPANEDLDAVVSQAQDALDQFADIFSIDEIALFFPTKHDLARATTELVRRPDVVHFNSAEDIVTTAPLGTTYRVNYEFFSIEGRTYRIEAMALGDGLSPLHEAFRLNNGIVVHTSFKVPDLRAYDTVLKRLGGLGGDYYLGQECRSTYGRFSYWRKHFEDDMASPWLKPRVNLRDGGF